MFNKIVIKNSSDNETIYQYLKRNNFSENYIRNLRKQKGYIKLNGEVVFTNHTVKIGDLLELYQNPNTKSGIMQNIIPLNIVYEDEDIIVINKPSGLDSIPSKANPKDSLANGLAYYFKDKGLSTTVRIINRLDKETSGLVCVAKHSLISNLLNSNIYIDKTYYAICTGKVEKTTIDKNILTVIDSNGTNQQKRVISEDGKPAITIVNPLKYDGQNTFCELKLIHGRTHQIRVHLSSIGHPLLGDSLYGTKSNALNHTTLVCAKMKIYNPLKNKEISLSVDIPKDIAECFKSLI